MQCSVFLGDLSHPLLSSTPDQTLSFTPHHPSPYRQDLEGRMYTSRQDQDRTYTPLGRTMTGHTLSLDRTRTGHTPPVDRWTDASENITFPRTAHVVGKYEYKEQKNVYT